MVNFFTHGLKPEVQNYVQNHVRDSQPLTLKETMNTAARYRESTNTEPSVKRGSNKSAGKRGTEPLTKLTDEERAYLMKIGGCFRCREVGHRAEECTNDSDKRPRSTQPATSSNSQPLNGPRQ